MKDIRQEIVLLGYRKLNDFTLPYMTSLDWLYKIKNDRERLINMLILNNALYYPKKLLYKPLDSNALIGCFESLDKRKYKVVDIGKKERNLYLLKNRLVAQNVELLDKDTFFIQCNEKLEELYVKNKHYFLSNTVGKELYVLSDGRVVLQLAYMNKDNIKVRPVDKLTDKDDFDGLIKMLYLYKKREDRIVQVFNSKQFEGARRLFIDL